MSDWADKEWAESFIKQDDKLGKLEEGTDVHCDLWEDLHDQWIEMNKETQDLIKSMRSDNG